MWSFVPLGGPYETGVIVQLGGPFKFILYVVRIIVFVKQVGMGQVNQT